MSAPRQSGDAQLASEEARSTCSRASIVRGWSACALALSFAGAVATAAEESCAGETWRSRPLAAVAATELALSVDAGGNLHAALTDGEGLDGKLVGPSSGHDWSLAESDAVSAPALVSGALGRTHLAYCRGAVGEGRIVVASNAGGSFREVSVLAAPAGADDRAPVVRVDERGTLHVAWERTLVDGTVEVWRWDSATETNRRFVEGTRPAFAFDERGRGHFVWFRGASIVYAPSSSPAADEGEEIVVDATVDPGRADIAVDATDSIAIGYRSGDALFLAVRDPETGELDPELLVPDGVEWFALRTSRGRVVVAYLRAGELRLYDGEFGDRRAEFGGGGMTAAVAVDGTGGVHALVTRDDEIRYGTNACAPRAEFSAESISGSAPFEVAFSAEASPAVARYEWDFGDGSTGSGASPRHVYREPGTYDVELRVFGIGGSKDTRRRGGYISVDRAPFLVSIPSQIVAPGEEDIWVPIEADHAEPIQGFQLGIEFDPAVLIFRSTDLRYTRVQKLEPEFYAAEVVDGRVRIGCIFDWSLPFDGRELAAGVGHRLDHLRFDVRPEVLPGSTTEIAFLPNTPGVAENVFAIENGLSVQPELGPSSIRFVDADASPSFLRGDADLSGRVNLNDAIVILKYLFAGGLTPDCLDAYDVNDAGVVDVSSAISVLNFLFLGRNAPRMPFPRAGRDPTDDSLGECRTR